MRSSVPQTIEFVFKICLPDGINKGKLLSETARDVPFTPSRITCIYIKIKAKDMKLYLCHGYGLC